jgi:hypothetical protein
MKKTIVNEIGREKVDLCPSNGDDNIYNLHLDSIADALEKATQDNQSPFLAATHSGV